MDYGQIIAAKVLVGERMGFQVNNAETAKSILACHNPHPIFYAAIEKEAVEIHNKICVSQKLIEQANLHFNDILKGD